MGKLTAIQAEIYRLYKRENLTQKEIAHRLGKTQQAISKQILNIARIYRLHRGCIKRGVVTPIQLQKGPKFWRYHALHFVVTPYYFFPRYARIRETRGNYAIMRDDWKIRLHEKKVEIILRRGFDFVSDDKYSSMALAEVSLNRILFQISNEFGFSYDKEGRIAIKLVKQHLARTNSSMAKANKGEFMQIKGIDGKVFFLMDKSKGILEHEYVHSKRLLSDSDRIEAFLNDLRENEGLSLSGLHSDQVVSIKTMAALTVQIKLHLKVMDRINKGWARSNTSQDELNRLLSELSKKLK